MTKRSPKGVAIALFAIALLLWAATIFNYTLGFVAPINAQAVGFDLWTLIIWLFFLYASRNLYRSFRKNSTSNGQSS